MSSQQSAQEIFERQFLEMRCGLLTLAAARDRISRASDAESVANDSRMQQLEDAIAIVASEGDDRAERLQMLFSDEYVENWNQ